MNTLENIINEIKEHDKLHPTHGVGCSCMDLHAGSIRELFDTADLYDKQKYEDEDGSEGTTRCYTKSLRNLLVVLAYVQRNT